MLKDARGHIDSRVCSKERDQRCETQNSCNSQRINIDLLFEFLYPQSKTFSEAHNVASCDRELKTDMQKDYEINEMLVVLLVSETAA